MTTLRRLRAPLTPWDELVERYAEGAKQLPYDAPEEDRDCEDMSDQVQVARWIIGEAVKAAQEHSLTTEDDRTHEILEEASQIASTIAWAYGLLRGKERSDPHSFEDRQRWSMTSQVDGAYPLDGVKRHGALQVDRDQLEHGIHLYLRSPYRYPMVDRVIVRALTDYEITHFIDAQVRPDPLSGKSRMDERRLDWGWEWWKGRARGLGYGALIVAALVALEVLWPQTPDWVLIGGALFVVFGYVVLTILATVILFVAAPRVRQAQQPTRDILEAMRTFFAEFRGSGPISVPFLRRRVEELRQLGVIWPGALWAMLDDLDRRGVALL